MRVNSNLRIRRHRRITKSGIGLFIGISSIYQVFFSNQDSVFSASSLGNSSFQVTNDFLRNDVAMYVFTLGSEFNYKGSPNIDLPTVTSIIKRVNGTWEIAWMQRSTG